MKGYLISIGIGLNMFFREYYLMGMPENSNSFTEQYYANLRTKNIQNGTD